MDPNLTFLQYFRDNNTLPTDKIHAQSLSIWYRLGQVPTDRPPRNLLPPFQNVRGSSFVLSQTSPLTKFMKKNAPTSATSS